ncbi:hypothetical protein TNIN_198841 [Trichonephila inaurata madagascariensis]|uniref:Uncharacterized protein n=1 Tax=Trichonephila inaurata madagascariensis TaxID=2747483 RepID=A0A8X7BN76_9ARAC|nr:hypothetical protein TNIN_198841 [Trichonephila inaurata madagascariensis]
MKSFGTLRTHEKCRDHSHTKCQAPGKCPRVAHVGPLLSLHPRGKRRTWLSRTFIVMQVFTDFCELTPPSYFFQGDTIPPTCGLHFPVNFDGLSSLEP